VLPRVSRQKRELKRPARESLARRVAGGALLFNTQSPEFPLFSAKKAFKANLFQKTC
jgi:hypothetical protein